MEYRGKFDVFDAAAIRTYPVSERRNKVSLPDLVLPGRETVPAGLPAAVEAAVNRVVDAVLEHRRAGRPVIVFAGGHLIKNGLGPLLADLVRRGAVTLVAGSAATAIHDFELALFGETSEDVPDALGKGQFGMAYEFAYLNTAVALGNEQRLGFGEALGRMMCDETFRAEVLKRAGRPGAPGGFAHPELSVLAACYACDVPFTVHAGIGVDVIDQHPSFDGEAKGGCSGRDFLIYARAMTRFGRGGVVLNIGSAVQGPEVLLKAVSMAANAGAPPRELLTADFDLRPYDPAQMIDETSGGYYCRDQKSVVTRVPRAFGGTGIYVQGNQKETFPLLYRGIVEGGR